VGLCALRSPGRELQPQALGERSTDL